MGEKKDMGYQTSRYFINVVEKDDIGGAGGYESTYLTSEGFPATKRLYSLLNKLSGESLPIKNKSIRQRNGSELTKALKQGRSLGIASGFKPSGAFHFGHKLTSSAVTFFQKNGAQIFMPVADLECMLDSTLTEEKYKFWAADNLLDWGANGLDLDAAHVYLQSEETRLYNLAYKLSRGVTFAEAIDIYGAEKLLGDPRKRKSKAAFPFLFAGMVQVADIVLPQHTDFGNEHSFMVSGQDQDGHMKMTTKLTKKAFKNNIELNGVQTIPSAFYIPHIRGIGIKASSSRPKETLYLGQGPHNEDIEKRIASSIKKIDSALKVPRLKKHLEECALDMVRYIEFFNENSTINFPEVLNNLPKEIEEEKDAGKKSELIDNYLIKTCNGKNQDNIDIVRETLPGALIEHQKKRQIVLDYAIYRAKSKKQESGWELDPQTLRPEFWKASKRAIIDSSKKTPTQWFNIVESMENQLIA